MPNKILLPFWIWSRGLGAATLKQLRRSRRLLAFLASGWGRLLTSLIRTVIYVAGEITTAWDLMEGTVRQALAERALTESAGRTPLRVSVTQESPRLRGAAALIAAPSFAAPRVA